MTKKAANHFFAFWNTSAPQIGRIVLGLFAILLSGYLISMHGSIILKLAVAAVLALLIFRFPFSGA